MSYNKQHEVVVNTVMWSQRITRKKELNKNHTHIQIHTRAHTYGHIYIYL